MSRETCKFERTEKRYVVATCGLLRDAVTLQTHAKNEARKEDSARDSYESSLQSRAEQSGEEHT